MQVLSINIIKRINTMTRLKTKGSVPLRRAWLELSG